MSGLLEKEIDNFHKNTITTVATDIPLFCFKSCPPSSNYAPSIEEMKQYKDQETFTANDVGPNNVSRENNI